MDNRKLERKLDRLSKYVMESKEFERKMFIAVIIIYGYIIFNICSWIGRVLF